MKLFKYFLSLAVLGILIWNFTLAATAAPRNNIEVVMFTRAGCVHCASMKAKVNELQGRGFDQIKLQEYEVFNNPDNQKIFAQYSSIFKFETTGVPVTVIGDQVIIGDEPEQLELLVEKCAENGCQNPSDIATSVVADTNQATIINTKSTVVGWVVIAIAICGLGGYFAYRAFKK